MRRYYFGRDRTSMGVAFDEEGVGTSRHRSPPRQEAARINGGRRARDEVIRQVCRRAQPKMSDSSTPLEQFSEERPAGRTIDGRKHRTPLAKGQATQRTSKAVRSKAIVAGVSHEPTAIFYR